MALARVEAEAAHQAGLRADRERAADTEDFGHMPIPIRVSLNAMSNWCIAREVHGRFVQFCRSSGNAKLAPVERIFDTNPHISWVLYSEPMAKVKNFQQ